MTTKYTQWPKRIPNGSYILQTDIKFSNSFYPKALQKFTHIVIFGL
jgi:hypothetical protein